MDGDKNVVLSSHTLPLCKKQNHAPPYSEQITILLNSPTVILNELSLFNLSIFFKNYFRLAFQLQAVFQIYHYKRRAYTRINSQQPPEWRTMKRIHLASCNTPLSFRPPFTSWLFNGPTNSLTSFMLPMKFVKILHSVYFVFRKLFLLWFY